MNCFECAKVNDSIAAVGVCDHCGVGLCLDHLIEAHEFTVGGTHYACQHQIPHGEAVARHAGRYLGRCPPPHVRRHFVSVAIGASVEHEVALLAKALGHPARVRILRLLLAKNACCCGEIVNELPLAQATVVAAPQGAEGGRTRGW